MRPHQECKHARWEEKLTPGERKCHTAQKNLNANHTVVFTFQARLQNVVEEPVNS